MGGGLDNDTYIVDNAGDIVVENANEGIDLVQSTINYSLGANIENLVLERDDALNGTGNALANMITGNSAANILDGGLGNDTLIGGAGDDTYVLDVATDRITENADEGIDSVRASFSYALGPTLKTCMAGSAAAR